MTNFRILGLKIDSLESLKPSGGIYFSLNDFNLARVLARTFQKQGFSVSTNIDLTTKILTLKLNK